MNGRWPCGIDPKSAPSLGAGGLAPRALTGSQTPGKAIVGSRHKGQ